MVYLLGLYTSSIVLIDTERGHCNSYDLRQLEHVALASALHRQGRDKDPNDRLVGSIFWRVLSALTSGFGHESSSSEHRCRPSFRLMRQKPRSRANGLVDTLICYISRHQRTVTVSRSPVTPSHLSTLPRWQRDEAETTNQKITFVDANCRVCHMSYPLAFAQVMTFMASMTPGHPSTTQD